MIVPLFVVDTSALMAVIQREEGWFDLRSAIIDLPGVVPAPVIVEFWRVARRRDAISFTLVSSFIAEMVTDLDIIAFTVTHANAAAGAAEAYGTGNGRGGLLSLMDLIVYGVAQVEALPILCTGNDFASTDAIIHPASRVG